MLPKQFCTHVLLKYDKSEKYFLKFDWYLVFIQLGTLSIVDVIKLCFPTPSLSLRNFYGNIQSRYLFQKVDMDYLQNCSLPQKDLNVVH